MADELAAPFMNYTIRILLTPGTHYIIDQSSLYTQRANKDEADRDYHLFIE